MINMNLLDTFLWLALAVWLYMSAWFVVAKVTNRADVVDSAWGLGFIYAAWLAWWVNGRQQDITLLAAAFVSLWGLRLFLHIFTRNVRKSEDYRYVQFRRKWGKLFWPQAYLRIFILQGVLLLLISTTTIAIMTRHLLAWHPLAIAGFAIWALGIIFEGEADAELRNFVKTKKSGEIMQKGLWRFSRHPNYFGEITTWWGAALVAISVGQYWGVIGALAITFLITKVSGIPPLEKHYASNKAYEKYKRHTSVLIPLPPKR